VDFLVGIGDVADEIITGRNEWNRVRGHCGNRLHPTSEKVNGNLELFLTIRWVDRPRTYPGSLDNMH
jgi:hypothetical protein